MTLFLTIIYWVLLISSIGTIIFSLPGTFFIILINFIYQLMDKVAGINWRLIIVLLIIAIALELAEFIMTAWSSKRFGASKQGTVGAIIGSIIGAIIGTGMFPFLGSLIGAFLGAFAGAFLIDFIRTGEIARSFQSGIGAFTGSVSGKLIKIIGAVGMLVIIAS